MDLLRSCYEAPFRFFTDTDEETIVRWYFTDAPFLPFDHAFGSGNWWGENEPQQRIGEVPNGPRKYYRGAKFSSAPAIRWCGTQEQWKYGDKKPVNPTPVLPDGVPACCWIGTPPSFGSAGDRLESKGVFPVVATGGEALGGSGAVQLPGTAGERLGETGLFPLFGAGSGEGLADVGLLAFPLLSHDGLQGSGVFDSMTLTMTRRIYTSGSNTWNKPAGLLWIDVLVVGGGAGGGACGNASGQAAMGSGGGAGAVVQARISAASLSSTETAVVGGGGNGGAAGANNGNDGSVSTFTVGGSVSLSAGGGIKGISIPVGTAAVQTGGPLGGTASGGDIRTDGGAGGGATRLSGTSCVSGFGGSNPVSGSAQSTVNVAGANGLGPGGGGSGASTTTTTSRAGGNGANGIIIIDEYTS